MNEVTTFSVQLESIQTGRAKILGVVLEGIHVHDLTCLRLNVSLFPSEYVNLDLHWFKKAEPTRYGSA